MFVELLDRKEKDALMMLLVNIAKADGDIDESEMDFLVKYAKEHGVELDMEKTVSISDACHQLGSQKAKVVTIQELVKLAIVDGNYQDAERAGAIAISEMLGIEREKFEEIEKWVLDGHRWIQKGIQMLG